MTAPWTANSALDWVCQHCLCCCSSLENDATYDVPIYANFLWMASLLNISIFRVQLDLLFIIFICSLYSPWAMIMLLHHFGFVCALILGYPCTHFSCHWCKMHNVLRWLTQISKRQRDPWVLRRLWKQHSDETCMWTCEHVAHPPLVRKKRRRVLSLFKWF